MKESVVNLQAAMLLRDAVRRRGHDTVMTRENNTRVSLQRRCTVADEHQVDVFVSLHCNSDGPKAHGFEVWTTPLSPRKTCAEYGT